MVGVAVDIADGHCKLHASEYFSRTSRSGGFTTVNKVRDLVKGHSEIGAEQDVPDSSLMANDVLIMFWFLCVGTRFNFK